MVGSTCSSCVGTPLHSTRLFARKRTSERLGVWGLPVACEQGPVRSRSSQSTHVDPVVLSAALIGWRKALFDFTSTLRTGRFLAAPLCHASSVQQLLPSGVTCADRGRRDGACMSLPRRSCRTVSSCRDEAPLGVSLNACKWACLRGLPAAESGDATKICEARQECFIVAALFLRLYL